MNCKEIQQYLWDLAEEKLRDEKAFPVKQHLGSCPSCRQSLDRIKNLLFQLEERKKVTANPFLYTRILQRMEAAEQKKTWLVPHYRSALLATLSVAAAIFLGINLVLHSGWYSGLNTPEVLSYQGEHNEFLAGDISDEVIALYYSAENGN